MAPERDGDEDWFLAVGKAGEEVITATVSAADEAGAEEEAMRTWETGGEEDIRFKHARGPFPSGLGDAATRIRPNGCAGCGLHVWIPSRPPRPCETWFVRYVDGTDSDSAAWECIQCGTLTYLPMEETA